MSDEQENGKGAQKKPGADRDRRVQDGSVLLKRIDDLAKVRHDSRIVHVHNEVVYAIDKACEEHKNPFSPRQREMLKDVVFQVVYILDPRNREPKGFCRKLAAEWRELTLLKKIATAAATAVFLATAILGALDLPAKISGKLDWLFGSKSTAAVSSNTSTSSSNVAASPILPLPSFLTTIPTSPPVDGSKRN
jgi:hypothetical protein